MTALHVRILKKLEGRGGLTLDRADIDRLVEIGVVAKIVEAGLKDYAQCLKDKSPSTPVVTSRSTRGQIEQTSTLSGMIEQPDVTEELARALATLPKPSKPLTESSLDKKPAQRAGRHTSGRAA